MKKLSKGRAKSQTSQPQRLHIRGDSLSRTAYVKFKPFSEECTMLNIEQKLQSYRQTMTHVRCSTAPTTAEEPLLSRLDGIINPDKRSRKHKRRNFTELDICSSKSSHESRVLDSKLARMKRRSQTINRFIPNHPPQHREIVVNPVRQDLSQAQIQQENAFEQREEAKSVLLTHFTKDSCYLFSRSKQKVLLEDTERPKLQPFQQPSTNNYKFQSFSTYFYGSYMRKYKERRRLLSKKTALAHIVAK